MKKCYKCGETKPLSEFAKSQTACKKCKHNYYKLNSDKWRKVDIKRRYGLSVEQYSKLKSDQDSCCYICGKTEKDNNRALAIDHCHSSNKVRKLLCDTCNRVLGLIKENTNTLHNMISYIQEHKNAS